MEPMNTEHDTMLSPDDEVTPCSSVEHNLVSEGVCLSDMAVQCSLPGSSISEDTASDDRTQCSISEHALVSEATDVSGDDNSLSSGIQSDICGDQILKSTHTSDKINVDENVSLSGVKIQLHTRPKHEMIKTLNKDAKPTNGLYIEACFTNDTLSCPFHMLIDSGASVSLCSKSLFDSLPADRVNSLAALNIWNQHLLLFLSMVFYLLRLYMNL